MLSDSNTYRAAGERALKLLRSNGYQVKSFSFDTGDELLIPDERAVGRMFMEFEAETSLIVSVGSGTLNDMAKYLSSRTGVPYIIVCTAPSMDGYASNGAPLICAGFKNSFVATLPYAIVGDTDIMKEAPMRLIQAGFGDVIGKITALADWELSRHATGEYYCETSAKLVRRALDKVISHAAGLPQRDEEAIQYLIEALTLTGVAIGLIGVSRPASGSEHQLSHFWEMDAIAKGEQPELHGIKVGIGTPIIAEFYENLADAIAPDVRALCPSREYVEGLLKTAGCKYLPQQAHVDKKLCYDCLIGADGVRKRYTILKVAIETGRLEEIARRITDRIYG
jgi:glycerol-1-phosphate dehydrogenase [NAD(P)+]